jgi:ribonuclease BN (tRNA processing enzyme)
MEVTFLDDGADIERCHARGHIHLRDVVGHIGSFTRQERIILTHFSQRYTKEMVEAALAEALPAEFLDKVTACTAGLSEG